MVNEIPVLGFAAFSGTGKTTLLKKLIPALRQRGLKITVVKHAHHSFDIDMPGKDSYELRLAGANQIIISSAKRFVKITEQSREKALPDCINEVDLQSCDLILVEGYKQAQIDKIELHRPSLGFPLLCEKDDNVIAVASDKQIDSNLPVLDLNNVEQIAEFILEYYSLAIV